ncbi:MAG: gliding motility-associated C-terminal domain-containing protein, partial [Bacteroidales bacterium]|nr:gliding motility-associated C-terminal domain-containing protein [Bacteroidales bacterium]
SVSSMDADIIKDLTSPVVTSIDTVSVDGSGKATISWMQSVSSDTRCYVIYQSIGSVWTAIDTICNTSTFVQNLISGADKKSELYTIAAIDSCGNISPMSKYHRTIFLEVNTDPCLRTNILSWNSYVNMNPLITGYKIYVSQNAGPYTLLTTLGTSDTTYTHLNLTDKSTYCYFVQAYSVSGQKSSSSNIVCETINSPKAPQYCYLKYATVLPDKSVEVSFYIDISGYIKKCNIVRSLDLLGPYNIIATIYDFSSSVINYTDSRVSVSSQSYYYKVVVIDSCDNEIITSNVGRTILLSVTANFDMSNSVTWNDYEDWLGGVKEYIIYRAIDQMPADGAPVKNLPKATTYTDFVDDYYYSEGSFKYYIRAVEGIGNPYGFTDSSTSNVVEVYQTPRVFIPSGFNPYGLNRILKPEGSFINSRDYEFLIFNRWGGIVYKSNSPEEGWDGRVGGSLVPIGVYLYLLKFNNFEGSVITKRGSVTVLY